MQLSLKLILVGGGVITFSVMFGFLAFEQILKFGIRDQLALRKRNEIRSIYLKLPFPLDFRVYLFNVTNPMEVQTGKTPVLEQVGPYCYDELIEKLDVVDNKGDDSLTYTPYAEFKFNQEKSGKLKDDDYVTILHPLVVGMVNKVNKDTPALLPIVDKAIGLLYPELKSIYLTARVKEILFEGIPINCKVSEFPAKAVCMQLKSNIPGLKITENEVYLFSILGSRNATKGSRVKVSRGISKIKDLGKLLEVDDKRKIILWGSEECNRFKGTDGWIFPPFLTIEEGVWSYSTDLCRSVGLKFVEDREVKGVNVRYYETDLGDMGTNEEEKCYCETPKTCLKKGVFDLSKCMGVPIFATLPHFLRTDEMYSKQITGLNPNLKDHIINVHLEPMTSTPLVANKRLQFNFAIAPNSKITLMKSIPEALHPVFWVEESVSLEGPLLKKITNIFLIIGIVKVGRWLGIAVGILILGYGYYEYFRNKREVQITPVHQPDIVSRSVSGRNMDEVDREEKGGNMKRRSILNGHEFERFKY